MIEQLLAELNQRLAENTATLRDVLAASGNDVKVVHTITPAEKPAKAKKEKAAPVESTPEPAVEPQPGPQQDPAPETPYPAAEETDPEPAPEWDRATYLLNITEFVKGKLVADGTGAFKASFEKLREQYSVKRVPELQDDQLAGFWNDIQSL